MALPIITIGRSFGSGGRLIGKKVATLLNIPLYDRELIALTAERSGFHEAVVEQMQQDRPASLLYTLTHTSIDVPLQDQVFFAQTKVIKELAAQGPCVIVGRCADSILEEDFDTLEVFIHAPLELRAERAEKVYHLEAKNFKDLVKKKDKARKAYYDYFAHRSWGKADHYDLCINSAIGIDLAADLIVRAARAMADE
ncbi:MAG: cytidylate kinase-like family protein [Clostridia bacterium]|nr:cytidylate kinase-like family protein [Clostridia bacterium]